MCAMLYPITGALMNPQLSRIEDEASMHELRELFALLEEKERCSAFDEGTHNINGTLGRALSILSWSDFESLNICPGLAEIETQQPVDRIEQHRKWLKAFHSAMCYLAKMLLVTDASLLIRLRRTLDRYAEIFYPNLLVVIQQKLQTLNSIKA